MEEWVNISWRQILTRRMGDERGGGVLKRQREELKIGLLRNKEDKMWEQEEIKVDGSGEGGKGRSRKNRNRSKGGGWYFFFFLLLSPPPTHTFSFNFSPPPLLSWELSFELLELFGDAVSVYQFVCALVRACVWEVANWAGVSRTKEQGRSVSQPEPQRVCVCVCVCVCVHVCACVCEPYYPGSLRKRAGVIKLSTWGICQGKQHTVNPT